MNLEAKLINQGIVIKNAIDESLSIYLNKRYKKLLQY